MKIALIGFSVEGLASYDYFVKLGYDITICDISEDIELPAGAKSQLGEGYLSDLDRFDLIVRSAGINRQIILDKNPSVASKITTAINEFIANCPTKNIIGVTGTKGKGTTCTLITKMLEASGATVWLGGNIGNSPLEFISKIQPDDWVVLELSSFQLSDLKHSPHIAVCLMVVPEHLNWHTDMTDYTTAKSHLFQHQTKGDIAIYFSQNAISSQIASHSPGTLIPFFAEPGALVNNDVIEIESHKICNTSDLKLLGKHNQQNVCAAITAVWQTGLHNITAINSVLKSFTGLPHRLEFVAENSGVSYYDDSFGTTPETAIVAIESFEQPKILIAGGSDKGSDYRDLTSAIKEGNVKHVVTIGDTGQTIAHLLAETGYLNVMDGGDTMEQIVDKAQSLSSPGDIVLLSTGSASFGLFKDYKDRGNRFKKVVQALQ